jgi:purine-cytosine permease-like protein
LFGLLLTGSSPGLESAVGADPIGGLGSILPTWYLIPFILVALLGLIGSAVLDIYSSGLALLSLGLKTPRYVAVCIDAVIMVLGTIYVVWVAGNFFASFQGFLITLGVPIAAWTGIFLADMVLRRKNYADADLYDRRGRYGAVNWASVGLLMLGSFVGFGLVTNGLADWLTWQGYLLTPLRLGGPNGTWASANLGVAVSLLIGFGGYLLLCRKRVAAQEQR